MGYQLTKEQFHALLTYFERALTVISDEEYARHIAEDKPLRNMLREIHQEQELLTDRDPEGSSP